MSFVICNLPSRGVAGRLESGSRGHQNPGRPRSARPLTPLHPVRPMQELPEAERTRTSTQGPANGEETSWFKTRPKKHAGSKHVQKTPSHLRGSDRIPSSDGGSVREVRELRGCNKPRSGGVVWHDGAAVTLRVAGGDKKGAGAPVRFTSPVAGATSLIPSEHRRDIR